jgi:uncharacterized repeat protein (TIGR03803 family)
VAGLVEASDGDLYGSMAAGGPAGQGTIFKISPSGKLTTLYGAGATTLLQHTNGEFYGTTGAGGIHGYGTVFRLSVGLPRFVKAIPAAGQVGTAVKMIGNDLTRRWSPLTALPPLSR